MTTLVTPDEVEALQAIAAELGIQLVREEEASGELVGSLPRLELSSGEEEEGGEEGVGEGQGAKAAGGSAGLGDVERLRKGLEDLYNLM